MRRAKQQREAEQRLVAAGPRPCAFVVSYGYAVIHRTTSGSCEWRVTCLDREHTPFCHVDADTFAAAIRIARTDGADLTREMDTDCSYPPTT